jgi:hypothetical protein
MGKYYEENQKDIIGADDALRAALEGDWKTLADNSQNPIEPWLGITKAPGGFALKDYDAFFAKTINQAKPAPPTKDDAEKLKPGAYDKWVTTHDDLVITSNEGGGSGYEGYVKELNRFVAELLGIPQDIYILPASNVGQSEAAKTLGQVDWNNTARTTGNYDDWHASPLITDMQDVLLYLYNKKDSARKDLRAETQKLIEDAEEAVGDNPDLAPILKFAKIEQAAGRLSDEAHTVLEAFKDPDTRATMLLETAQCVLRLSIGDYVRAHQITSANVATTPIAKLPRYHKSIYLSYGNGTTLINRLAYCENSEHFIGIKTHEISQLVPMIRLYKSYYEEGKLADEVEINFGNALLGPRSGVGIKSFDWKLNATNPATVRNDIEVTLVLFFESFNELLRPLAGEGTITGEPRNFQYQDLLLRPSVEPKDDAQPSAPPESMPNCTENNNIVYDPKFYEIKALVGWATPPNLDAGNEDRSKDLLKSINSQKLPMFLTLIDHEFSFTQEGTFELSITYRARLEAIENDPRMDILSTAKSKEEINERLIKIHDLKKTCGTDTLIGRQTKAIESIDEAQRDILTESLIDDLQCVIYFTKLLRKDFFSGPVFEAFSTSAAGNITGLKVFKQDVIDSINARQETYRAEIKEDLKKRFVTPTALDNESPAYKTEQKEKKKTELESGGFLSVDQPPPRQKRSNLAREPEEEILIPWFYFGDLANAVIRRCFDVNISTDLISPGAISSVELENFIFLFSSFPIKEVNDKGDTETIQANLADVPISLELFNQWYLENVINPNKRNYPVLEFLRDFISDAVIGTLNKDCYDSPAFRQLWFNAEDFNTKLSNAQAASTGPLLEQDSYSPIKKARTPGDATLYEISRLILKTTAISLPSEKLDGNPAAQGKNSLGGNPLEKVKEWSETGYASAIINPDKYDAGELNLSKRASSESQTLKNSYHLNVFYLLNSDSYIGLGPPAPGALIREERDFKNGIYHLYLGADRGLVKSVSFSKVSAQYLREARIQQESLNPLAQLAATYNVNLKLIGNTIFWPGQYIFVNPIGFGNGLGLPDDRSSNKGFGSISNQLGLGGYHLITEVNNFIESGKFETEVKALFEFSGDGCPSLPGATPTSNCNNSSIASSAGTATKDIAQPPRSPDTAGQPSVSSAPAHTKFDGLYGAGGKI